MLGQHSRFSEPEGWRIQGAVSWIPGIVSGAASISFAKSGMPASEHYVVCPASRLSNLIT